jgi:hypothetical protein
MKAAHWAAFFIGVGFQPEQGATVVFTQRNV